MNIDIIEQQGFKLLDLIEETNRVYTWKAVQRNLERSVFLTILKEGPSADPLEVEYFLHIARQFAKTKSDSIVAVFDIVSKENLHYVIMEHVEGESLEEMVEREHPFDFKQIMQVAFSVTGGLKQIWNNSRIIHRNIQGSTIRYDARGIAKIIDFSLAVIADPEFDISVIDKGHVLGNPSFIAPEQSHADEIITAQSDMYAMGALLYYISTGTAPFSSLDADEILDAQLSSQLTPPHHLNTELPPVFSRLLHKLMMKDARYRYQNWEEIHHDLHCIISDKKPICANSDLAHQSSVAPDFSEIISEKNQEPQLAVRIKKKKRNEYLSSIQDKHVSQHQDADTKKGERTTQLICWGLLMLWLAAIFWYRSVLQVDPQKQQDLLNRGKQALKSFEELIPESNDESPDETAGSVTDLNPAEQNERIKEISRVATATIAKALANNNLSDAINALVSTPDELPQKTEIMALLKGVPAPDQLVADFLIKNTGKAQVMNFKGKPHKVMPVKVINNMVTLEANGKSMDLDISTLSVEQKLNWIGNPSTAEENLAKVLMLLQSQRRTEAAELASACGILAEAVEQAVKL